MSITNFEIVNNDSLECGVCLEDFKFDTVAQKLPCAHVFHQCCLTKWMCEIGRNYCPLCRKEIPRILGNTEEAKLLEKLFENLKCIKQFMEADNNGFTLGHIINMKLLIQYISEIIFKVEIKNIKLNENELVNYICEFCREFTKRNEIHEIELPKPNPNDEIEDIKKLEKNLIRRSGFQFIIDKFKELIFLKTGLDITDGFEDFDSRLKSYIANLQAQHPSHFGEKYTLNFYNLDFDVKKIPKNHWWWFMNLKKNEN